MKVQEEIEHEYVVLNNRLIKEYEEEDRLIKVHYIKNFRNKKAKPKN
tara:strand:- start:96 stop:236 length:141 start_codon:yes stop_codon:yes gene_type:complete